MLFTKNRRIPWRKPGLAIFLLLFLQTGLAGTIIALICCATPVLVILFGAIGLSAYIGWLDMVLLPSLAIFLIFTGYALWKCKKVA